MLSHYAHIGLTPALSQGEGGVNLRHGVQNRQRNNAKTMPDRSFCEKRYSQI